MNENEVPIGRLDLQDDREILSPPIVLGPLYRCATAVTVIGFVPHAQLDLEIDGTITSEPGGFPSPDGHTFVPVGPLATGQTVRARQWRSGVPSAWSDPVVVRDHTEDYPIGLPRPQINPAPVYACGARTGVANLITGSNVWIEADAAEVGRVEGAKEHQGVNVNPDYGLGQNVRAFTELCDDLAPPSELHITQTPPSPLPTPAVDDVYEEGEQIRISGLVNGARFTVTRGGTGLGTWRTWGGAHLVDLSPALSAGETLEIRQRMCPGSESDPGGTTVKPCSELPAPTVASIQAGDTVVRLLTFVPDAEIKVFAGLEKIGEGGGVLISLVRPVEKGETVYVMQSVGGCEGQTARVVPVQCVAPPVANSPANLDLFPVGHFEYNDGDLTGIVYYPAEDDGEEQPFRERVAEAGPVPIVFIAHGNHGIYYNPADRNQESCSNPGGWIEIPNYKGYNYLQRQLARMGIVSVSIDCNATNCASYSFSNIEARAELILRTVDFFMSSGSSELSLIENRFDIERAALVGHSRGGEAVILAANQAPGALSVQFKAVISLAPTDARLYSVGASLVPGEYAFMTVLPAGDGDVISNDGAKLYDTQEPSPFKSQLYVHGTGHNYFNREWPYNDGVPFGSILSRTAHERILSAYGCALLRTYLLNHSLLGFLTYRRLPAGVAHDLVHLSFEFKEQLTVDDHEQGNTIHTNTLGLPTQQMGGLNADEYTLSQLSGPAPQYSSNTFYGNTIGMVAECRERIGVFRTELNGEEISPEGTEIWIRAGEVYMGGSLPSGTTGFELGVEDSAGTTAWIDSDEVGGLPRPYERSSYMKSMLKTMRFPLACFKETQPRLEIESLKAILIRCNREDQRSLSFDVLQLVRE